MNFLDLAWDVMRQRTSNPVVDELESALRETQFGEDEGAAITQTRNALAHARGAIELAIKRLRMSDARYPHCGCVDLGACPHALPYQRTQEARPCLGDAIDGAHPMPFPGCDCIRCGEQRAKQVRDSIQRTDNPVEDVAMRVSDLLIATSFLGDDNRVMPEDLAKLLTETRKFERARIATEQRTQEAQPDAELHLLGHQDRMPPAIRDNRVLFDWVRLLAHHVRETEGQRIAKRACSDKAQPSSEVPLREFPCEHCAPYVARLSSEILALRNPATTALKVEAERWEKMDPDDPPTVSVD